LRRINSSYSKISFADVARKIGLNKNSDVEFIIAKAVRDGVITAKLSHED
jgi:26S proteasome regulatory subunit N3